MGRSIGDGRGHGQEQMLAVCSWRSLVLLPSIVTLSAAKGLSAALHCHPERSEGSFSMGTEMLRYAQHDNLGSLCSPGVSPFATLKVSLLLWSVTLRYAQGLSAPLECHPSLRSRSTILLQK